MPMSGSTYQRLRVIGRGGMGEIFLALQRGVGGFQRPVALKRILPERGRDPELRRMFLAEARAMAALSHPNICQTIDLCSMDADLFLVLEYLEGTNLEMLIQEAGPLPFAIVGGLLLQACAGLEHAHSKGLVHRDLSPSNLFITSNGQLKILDFGVAKWVGSGTSSSGPKGKSPYMSPEQVAGGSLDARSDVFSLGALGLEALTGTSLFLRESDYLTYQAILEATRPIALSASPLDRALAGCLSVEPAERPPSARALARVIEAALAPHGGPASPLDVTEFLEQRMAATLRQSRELLNDALEHHEEEPPLILHTVQLTAPAAPAADRPFGASKSRVSVAKLLVPAIGLVALTAWITSRAMRDDAARPAIARAEDRRDAAPPATASLDAAPVTESAPLDASPPGTDAGAQRPPPHVARKPGYVSIDAKPYAAIRIDGRSVGNTPVLKHPLPAGSHEVVAVTKDGREKRFRVRVRPGATMSRRLVFESTAPAR
jgi:serine/threonine protein kinase